MIRLAIICTMLLLPIIAGAQVKLCDSSGKVSKGTIRVVSDPGLATLVAPVPQPEIQNGEEPKMPGYRVQVYSGAHRNDAIQIKTQLLQTHPELPVYLTYEAPYFKVRAGDFRNKLEAQHTLHLMKEIYTGVLLVPDKINFPPLAK